VPKQKEKAAKAKKMPNQAESIILKNLAAKERRENARMHV
jgi:hypothetical protein